MKRWISTFLVASLIVSLFSLSSGTNVSASAVSDSLEKNDIYYSETFESNGVQYFFEDTEQYTISIAKSNTGERTIAYKDKLSGKNDEIYYITESEKIEQKKEDKAILNASDIDITTLNASDVTELENIREKVLKNEIILEKQTIHDFAKVTHYNESKDLSILPTNQTSSGSQVFQALADQYGKMYTYKYLSSLNKKGVTGYLYQHMTFGAYRDTSFLFDALASISIISTMTGTPITGLMNIASWIAAGTGLYELLRPTEFTKYNATVYLQKEVKVANEYPYRAFYDRHLTALTGSQGTAALSSIKRTYKSNDYDNNSTLLNKGIDIYVGY